jgi:hypothetical protein
MIFLKWPIQLPKTVTTAENACKSVPSRLFLPEKKGPESILTFAPTAVRVRTSALRGRLRVVDKKYPRDIGGIEILLNCLIRYVR